MNAASFVHSIPVGPERGPAAHAASSNLAAADASRLVRCLFACEPPSPPWAGANSAAAGARREGACRDGTRPDGARPDSARPDSARWAEARMGGTRCVEVADRIADLRDHPVPPATVAEARSHRDALARLLARERHAAADFLLALADFDRRRGWEALGHASLFAFLNHELGLSKGAAYLRFTAARLLPAFPEVEAALREGKLCLSAVGELSRVITPQNRAEVLPRFFGCSSREAREVAAALVPRPEAPRREVVTQLPGRAVKAAGCGPVVPPVMPERAPEAPPRSTEVLAKGGRSGHVPAADSAGAEMQAPPRGPASPQPSDSVRAHELEMTHPARAAPLDEAEPLDADLRRLHVTVSRRFLAKLDRARDGLSHAQPGATAEQVLEAALDLLLEKQARRLGLVSRLRKPVAVAGPAPSPRPCPPVGERGSSPPTSAHPERSAGTAGAESRETSAPAATPAPTPTARLLPPPPPRAPSYIPAAVRCEVWLRDGGRCQFPLDAGGICGSTVRPEFDHIVPRALGGASTAANLRVACCLHNRAAARAALGSAAAIRSRPGDHPK